MPRPYDLLLDTLKSSGLSDDDRKLVPKKWEKLGTVLFFHLPSTLKSPEKLRLFREAVIKVLKCKEVCIQQGVETGELREPQMALITGTGVLETLQTLDKKDINFDDIGKNTNIFDSPTFTIHTENKIKFSLDVRRVMFASGNGTERMRMAQMPADNDVVVDMFAGIGYFSIPLAKRKGTKAVYSIEKNPVSCLFLMNNAKLNKVENTLHAFCGDNRQITPIAGQATRVLMGYIPTPVDFIPRAFEFCSPDGAMIHYHYLCGKEEIASGSVALADFEKFKSRLPQWSVQLIHNECVKNYAPHVYHCVADLYVKRTDETPTKRIKADK